MIDAELIESEIAVNVKFCLKQDKYTIIMTKRSGGFAVLKNKRIIERANWTTEEKRTIEQIRSILDADFFQMH